MAVPKAVPGGKGRGVTVDNLTSYLLFNYFLLFKNHASVMFRYLFTTFNMLSWKRKLELFIRQSAVHIDGNATRAVCSVFHRRYSPWQNWMLEANHFKVVSIKTKGDGKLFENVSYQEHDSPKWTCANRLTWHITWGIFNRSGWKEPLKESQSWPDGPFVCHIWKRPIRFQITFHPSSPFEFHRGSFRKPKTRMCHSVTKLWLYLQISLQFLPS